MAKGPWEARVGKLLQNRDVFAYSFKPPDSKMYGGQPRVDWLATDNVGRSWMIEVKEVGESRRSISFVTQITPGQIQALSAISRTRMGIPLLAVGQGRELYIYHWRTVEAWRETAGPSEKNRLPLVQADWVMRYERPRYWSGMAALLYSTVLQQVLGNTLPPTQTIRIEPEGSLLAAALSRSISRRKGSTPTSTPTAPLVLSSSVRETAAVLSSEISRVGGRMRSKMVTPKS